MNTFTIRSATEFDCEAIAKELWRILQQFKIRQLPSRMHSYPSSAALADKIQRNLSAWLVCEPSGFFSVLSVGEERTYKRWGFPKCTVQVTDFGWLNSAETLLGQFEALANHLSDQSILINAHSSLRDVHWAALKAGFRELGDSSSIVGSFSCLYLDRENRHDEIQAKLRRAKIVFRGVRWEPLP